MIGIGIVIGIGGEKRYASFALAMCWPKIEISIQRDFAAATLIEDGNEFKVMGSGQLAVKKVKGAGFFSLSLSHHSSTPLHPLPNNNLTTSTS